MTNKSTILFFLLSFFMLTSCKDDGDDPGAGSDSVIVGTWNMKDISYSGTTTTSFPGSPDMTTNFTGQSTQSDYKITFNADNTYSGSGTYTINLTYEFAGQTITQPIPVSADQAVGSGTWELSGNTLTTTTDAGQTSQNTVTDLTDNSFSLAAALTQTQSFNGATITFDIDAVFNATK